MEQDQLSGARSREATSAIGTTDPVPGRQGASGVANGVPGRTVVQRKLAVGGDPAAAAVPTALGGGTQLPAELRLQMERAFGHDFSAVRVYESPAAAQVGARAFARGNDLCFAPGQFDPGSESGRALIGHELAHVVQQREGRVSTDAAQGDANIVADVGLETEADALGARAARGETVGAASSGQHDVTSGPIQRQINCTDPHVVTAGWQMDQWGQWLENRGITWANITGSGVVLPPVLATREPQANRIRSLAHHELLGLQRDVVAHPFATLDLVHAEVARRTATTLASMVASGVGANELDVALDMYGRLDGRGPGDEAVLHKLEWHDVHEKQYARNGVDAAQVSQQGLVYGPWRASGGGQPTDNTSGVDDNVHTMPLNVVWLLACAHHGVSLRLYAPPTERGLFRQASQGMVNNATTNAPQRKLSALAREIIALVGGGMYTAALHNDPGMPAGFQDTWLLTPTVAAFDATMANLSVDTNSHDMPQITTALAPLGIAVVPIGSPAEAQATHTVNLEDTRKGHERNLVSKTGIWVAGLTPARIATLRGIEDSIMLISGETREQVRHRVLGTVTATFECNYVTRPGQEVLVCGNLDELGAWDEQRARPLAYSGAAWRASFVVSKDQQARYKYIVRDQSGAHWEVGNDHLRLTTVNATYNDNWGAG